MNAFMNIQVRVAANQAAATLRSIRSGLADLNAQLDGNSSRARTSTRTLSQWGNQVQWTGRQIQTNWTLPLVAAAGAAVKWELANESAFTRISKLYGTAAMSASTMKNELKALSGAFEALSNHYGVQQTEVLSIAADWAAAGASGIALAKGVEATLQAMILGELGAADATKSLIAIQAQYGTDTAGLVDIIGTLNAVENETGVSMGGLIQGFARSAGVARQAGVDYRHLAAMIAALSPAAGSAAEAGNALKTIFSRLSSPTKETTQVLGLMGISMKDAAWQSSSATQQLEILSKKFGDLSDKQKEVVSTTVASRWQINKFSILMRELSSTTGYYQRALTATSDPLKVYATYHKELNTVLSSNPQRLKQMWVMLQNAATDIIQPMIPLVLYLAHGVQTLVTSFSNLDPGLQKLILFGAASIAALGPILRYAGSLATVFGFFGSVIGRVVTPLRALAVRIGALVAASWSGLIFSVTALGAAINWLGLTAGMAIGRLFTALGWLVMQVPAIMRGMATAISVAAPIISGAWAALMYGLGAILGPVGVALLRAWRVTMLALSILTTGIGAGLTRVWAAVWAEMQVVMVASARILGMIWRAATMSTAVTTMAWGTAFSRLWSGIWYLTEATLIATAATLGVVWRTGLAAMRAITMGFGSLFGATWAAVMVWIRTITTAVSTSITFIWRVTMITLSVITAELGRALSVVWSAVWFELRMVMVAVAGVMGMTWRLFMLGMSATTAIWGAAFTRLWTGIHYLLRAILIGGATVLGAIWRATLAAMAAATIVFAPIWAAGWSALVWIAMNSGRAIGMVGVLIGRTMAFIAMSPLRFAAVFKAGWDGLLWVARASLSGIVALATGAVSAIGWPVIAIIAAVVALVIIFWDQIKTVWNNIISYFQNSGNSLVVAVGNIFGSLGNMMSRVFNLLPQSVKNAMLAVVSLVAAAARKVYELFSYINPFAHHSPSLVENVTKGMAEVGRQFATLSKVEGYVKSAYATIKQFSATAASMGRAGQEMNWANQRKDISKVNPSALPAFDALINQIRILTPILATLDSAIAAQQSVVDAWQAALDRANASLDKQQKKLDTLSKTASNLSTRLDAANQSLQDWASTPIKGQQAMSDAIFNNAQAQKALQLQMMKMQEVTGPLDDIKTRMAAINGEMDQLTGMRTSLQQGGAGADILSVYDSKIGALKGQGTGLSSQAKQLQDMQNALDALATQGQKLDLQNSLQFDGLTRQIDLASKSIKEMPFDVILAGVKSSRIRVDELTKAYDAANAAVAKQQKVVDAATAARDAIQARYDTETAKLKKLKDAYDSVNNAIQGINASLQLMTQAASDALSAAKGAKPPALTQGAQNFVDAAGGNFPAVGGAAQIGRTGGNGDQSALIDDFTKQLADQTSGMFAGLNPLGPLKKYWNIAWAWLKKYIGPLFTALGDFMKQAFDGIGNPFSAMGGWSKSLSGWIDPAKKMIGDFTDTVVNVFTTLWGWLVVGWNFIKPFLKQMWDALVGGLKKAWDQISPELAKFKDLLKPLGDAVSNLWTLIKPVLAIIAVVFVGVLTLIADVLINTLGPIFDMLGGIIAGFIKVLRGVIEFIIGVFTLDWKMMWTGIKDIFGGIWKIIASIVSGAWNIIWGVLKGAMKWLGQVFGLIFDKAIAPAWKASWGWISKTARSSWNGILDFFKGIGRWFSNTFSDAMHGVGSAWNGSIKWISSTARSAWNGIWGFFKGIGHWFNNTFSGVMDSVGSAFRSSWNGIVGWFKKAAPWIVSPLKGAINLVISAINKMVDGLNKVGSMLPGLNWHITHIPKLAQGGAIPGRRVGNGFVTNGPRAIVGEGNPVHPEFVVPTDPLYRKRALGLFGMLGHKLGAPMSFMGGVPAYAGGGILDSIKGAIGDAGNFVSGLSNDLLSHIGDGVATYIMKPIFKLVDPMIKKVPWDFGRGAARGMESKLIDWLKSADSAAKAKVDEGGIGKVPAGQIRDWISSALGIIKQSTTISPGIYNIIMHESGGNPRAINLTDSNAKAGHPSKGLMQTIDGTFNRWSIKGHKDIWNPIDNIIAGTRYALNRYGAKWLAGGGNKDANGNYIGYAAGGILNGVSRTIPSLAQGAYIRRTVGGTIVRVGEGSTDEAVLPLPKGGASLGGSKTLNFYGDLSFPNIKSGDDAKRFLDNLESLAEG